jgi:hypothetical protein
MKILILALILLAAAGWYLTSNAVHAFTRTVATVEQT